MLNDCSDSIEDAVAYVSRLVSRLSGVQLGKRQAVMVENRLRSRMLQLGVHAIADYLQILKGDFGNESKVLLSLLTTHHSHFFRETHHFEILISELLPTIYPRIQGRADKTLKIWSAACSRGQEVYSLAMMLHDVLSEKYRDISFSLLGSDVDAVSIKVAQNGVYSKREIKDVPLVYLSRYFGRGTGDISDFFRIKNDLRVHCQFRTWNILDHPPAEFLGHFDIIFCRNVFIYFAPEKITEATRNLMVCLRHGGRLFIGASESLNGLDVAVNPVGPSVYRSQGLSEPTGRPTNLSDGTGLAKTGEIKAQTQEALIRVFCVDDSQTIVAMLAQILRPEFGFEICGTAANGQDAADAIKRVEPDLVLLDLHMPILDGVGYLTQHLSRNHPPVLMLSSSSREEQGLAERAIELGAVDYIEKPRFSNLGDKSDEIRMKLRTAWRMRQEILESEQQHRLKEMI